MKMGGQFPPEWGGQFAPENYRKVVSLEVVNLLRNQVVNLTGFSNSVQD
jgi:hypothetical protein